MVRAALRGPAPGRAAVSSSTRGPSARAPACCRLPAPPLPTGGLPEPGDPSKKTLLFVRRFPTSIKSFYSERSLSSVVKFWPFSNF